MDDIDRAIIGRLAVDGGMSNKRLAAEVGLSPSSCLERVRRLKSDRIIRGIHADVDVGAIGVRIEALLFIRLVKHTANTVNEFFEQALTVPESRGAYIISGQHDMIVHVAAEDTAHLKNLILNSFTSIADVSGVETVIIFDLARRWMLPERNQ